MNSRKGFYSITLSLGLALAALLATARAADDKAVIDPTGTWKVTIGKGTYEPTLKLKAAGDKVTGTMSRAAGNKIEQITLEDGKLNKDEIAFTTHVFALVYQNNVLQPPDTNQMSHSKYRGKIVGDTIKGKVERESSVGNARTLDWEAKRVGK